MSQKSDKECEKEVGGKRELESLLSVKEGLRLVSLEEQSQG